MNLDFIYILFVSECKKKIEYPYHHALNLLVLFFTTPKMQKKKFGSFGCQKKNTGALQQSLGKNALLVTLPQEKDQNLLAAVKPPPRGRYCEP